MSTDIERHQGGGIAIPSREETAHMELWAKRYAASKQLCPRAFQDKPEDIMLVWQTMQQKGVPFSLDTLNQCWVNDGKVEMMAQLKVGIVARYGWDMWFNVVGRDGKPTGEVTDERAIVHYRGPGKPERMMEYTIGEARSQRLLDEWVEQNVEDGTWPDSGRKKYRKVKATVAVDGEPLPDDQLPDWAKAERQKKGAVRRKDPWFNSRQSMLMARAVTKALRYAAPNLLLGLGEEFDVGTAPEQPAEQFIDAQADDVEPETGELVSFREAGGRLVDTFVGLGYSRDEAKEHARWLWQVAGLQPGDSVARTRLDMLLALAGEAPSRNPTEKDGDDSPDGTGIPAPVEDGEAAQARSHDPGGADESGQEPSDAKVSGRRRGNSASAAAGPDTAPEIVQAEVMPPAVHDDAPEAGNLFEYGPDEEPF